jgi:hypothetical protein
MSNGDLKATVVCHLTLSFWNARTKITDQSKVSLLEQTRISNSIRWRMLNTFKKGTDT